MRRLGPLALALLLAGCGARDCAYGIAHRDCVAEGNTRVAFPQDDVICRSYGLTPGTRDYATCRASKQHERQLTRAESDYGFLRNPILPDLR